MNEKAINVLLIEDNPGDARLIRELLGEPGVAMFTLECLDQLSTGLKRLAEGGIDVILLDLGLPDSQGLDTFTRAYERVQHVPIVVLTGLDDDMLAIQAMRAGAQDYLAKGQMDSNLLMRTMSYAIERKRAEEQIRRMNEELEQRVAERTLELQETNEALQESLETLRKTQAQLVESEKIAALGNLVAGVAHEINTPVGVGVTAASYLAHKTAEFSELYASGNLARSDLQRYIDTTSEASFTILNNLQRAADLIVTFKQVAVDQSSEERRKFRLKEYIDAVLFSLCPRYKRTRHTTTINCPEALELDSYPGAYSQVITNLVMNSLIHGFEEIEEGQIVFDISVDGGELLFRYSDSGRGMDEESTKRIFDPFYTTKRSQGGTGLGMHIVYNLVTQTLGGQIECTSQPGNGTTFSMTIPLELETDDGSNE